MGQVLFIKHIDIEGPDTLGEFFKRRERKTRTIDLHRQGALPVSLKGIDAVVSLGGPMNVYEEEKYPFLKEENDFVRRVVADRVPYLGICLGSQILAKACGAKVGLSPEKEIGFFTVDLSEAGRRDPLFSGLPARLNVFQWHQDMSELPAGAVLLASSRECPTQAFKVGACAYGIQFHIEVTQLTVREWADEYFNPKDPVQMAQKEAMAQDYSRCERAFNSAAETMYINFLKIIDKRAMQYA